MKGPLRKASRLWGIQTEFINVKGDIIKTPEATLRELLKMLSGLPVEDVEDLEVLIAAAQEKVLERGLQPVNVILAESAFSIPIYFPELIRPVDINIYIEDTQGYREMPSDFSLKKERERKLKNKKFDRYRLTISHRFQVGYHKIKITVGDWTRETLLFSAPSLDPLTKQNPKWGAFAPLYALRSQRDWGIGGTGELLTARKVIKKNGGEFFGILPLLPCDYEREDVDPSPYSPLSRLFWNEIYLDVESLDGAAQVIEKSSGIKPRMKELKDKNLVDYKKVYQLKKEILLELSRVFFATHQDTRPEFKNFLNERPEVSEYARFRAGENEAEYKFHLYVQFQMEAAFKEQKALTDAGEIADVYLDFPIGVSRKSFDNQAFSKNFLLNASAGAPPDLMFSKGQNWGFAPLHPHHIREEGYEYFIKCLRQHLKYAGLLRFDHAMGFYRIYAIPQNFDAKSGAYIRFKQDEFLAILKIESFLSGVKIVGEDLGTVPEVVRKGLSESKCLRMWVWPFEAGSQPLQSVKKAPVQSLSCLNTHDMIPFEGFLKGRDLELFEELSIMTASEKRKEGIERKALIESWMKSFEISKTSELFVEVLQAMSRSPSSHLLINIEDLWRETEPHNIPGTWREYPNWQKKLRFTIEEWSSDPKISKLFSHVSEWRKVV